MEGERILRNINCNGSWELTFEDTQNYLKPLLSDNQPPHSNKRLLEYEKFSYKLLRRCVVELSSGGSSINLKTVLKISNLCVECLGKYGGRSGKNKTLHFEKLLLNLADGCRVAGSISECVKVCRQLHGRLSPEVPEEAVLVQQAFEVLWLASPLRRLHPPSYSAAAPFTSVMMDHLCALMALNLPVANVSLTNKNNKLGVLCLCEAVFGVAVWLGQQRQYLQAVHVQQIVCDLIISYCQQDTQHILHRAREAGLLSCLQYLARLCRKVHDAPAAEMVFQHIVGLLPKELQGVDLVGVVHEELARARLEKSLLDTWGYTRTSGAEDKEVKEDAGRLGNKKTMLDSLLKETSNLCLQPQEEAPMKYHAPLTCTLSDCVQSWEEMCRVVEKSVIHDVLYKPAEMLEDLYITALVCAIHCLPLLVLRVCEVLLRLLDIAGEVLGEAELASFRNKALALQDEICSNRGVKCAEYSCESEGVGGGDEGVASLWRRLERARLQLQAGQTPDCRAEVLYIVDHLTTATCTCEKDYHCRGFCPEVLVMMARTRLLTAQLLLQCPDSSSEAPSTGWCEPSWSPTPVQLAQDAMKQLWKMVDGYKAQIKSDSTHIGMLAYTNVWEGLLALLQVIKMVCHVYVEQGCVEKVYNILREATMLTKTLQLGPWYCEMLLLLGQLFVVRGNSAPALLITQQLSQLLDCTDFTGFLASPDDYVTPPTLTSLLTGCSEPGSLLLCQRLRTVILCGQVTLMEGVSHVTRLLEVLEIADEAFSHDQVSTGSVCATSQPSKTRGRGKRQGVNVSEDRKCTTWLDLVWADLVCLRAECHLLAWQPECARQLVSDALERLRDVWPCVDHLQLRLLLARLHFLKGKSISQQINGKQEILADEGVWLPTKTAVRQCTSEFQHCYELCFPVRPAVLLREACLWLAFLSKDCEDVHHYLSSGQQISLSHHTSLVLNNKIQALMNGGQRSSSWKQVESHISDIRCALGASQRPLPTTTPSSCALLRAHTLCASLLPQPTNQIMALLPPSWTFLTMALSPKPHPSCQSRLIVTRATPTPASKSARPRPGTSKRKRPVPPSKSRPAMSSVLLGGGGEVEKLCEELQTVLREANYGLDISEKKSWWTNRKSLDKRMKTCLENLECLAPSDLPVVAGSGPVLLVLGCGLQHIPWETLPFLQDAPVVRTPSLLFAATHKTMVDAAEVWPVDVDSAYYVVNPQGDLKKTQELFGGRFCKQEGWEGVVSAPPTPEQLSKALENKSLYIYCGHGSGSTLSDDSLRALSRCATSLIMGCRSGQLRECGRYDPTGHALNYLMAGCPAVVGCLWTVTDGDLDRFCDGLITSLLSADPALLPAHVTRSRLKCRLQWLIGASAVVYGLPVQPQRRPRTNHLN